MRFPFFWPALGFTAGILLRPYSSWREDWIWQALISASLLLLFLRGRRLFLPVLLFAFACLGNLFSQVDHRRPADAVERFAVEAHEKNKPWVWIEGRVLIHPEVKQTGRKQNVSFVLSAERFTSRRQGKFHRERVRGKVQVFLLQPQTPLPEAGERVRIFGRLEIPKPVLNAGGFDYRKYLSQQNIFCILNGYGKKSLRLLGAAEASGLERIVFTLQKKIAEKINRLFHGDSAVLFKALLLGTRRGLSPELREDFYRTGTSQVFAMPNRGILESSVASNFVINASS